MMQVMVCSKCVMPHYSELNVVALILVKFSEFLNLQFSSRLNAFSLVYIQGSYISLEFRICSLLYLGLYFTSEMYKIMQWQREH
jgi:hypothetical protein